MSPVVDVRTVSAQQASASVLCPPCASCCCCRQGLCKFQAFIRWQTDGRAGGMAWLAGSLKNAYDLCKQFPIRSAPWLSLGSPCAPVTWRYAQLGQKYMCICIWIGCIKYFMDFGAKVTLCRGRAISEVCVCDFRLSLHVLSHMAVSVSRPVPPPPSLLLAYVCLFAFSHFYAFS